MTHADQDQSLLDLAVRSARAAGAYLRVRPAELQIAVKSSPTDVVTQMDRASEELLVSMILAERPHDGILGEEGGERPGTTGVRWVLDPLDGTTNYLYGVPLWSVSVAAEIDGTVVAGAVDAPMLGCTYAASRGGGAREIVGDGWRDLRASHVTDLAQALVSTGFGYDSAQRRRQALQLVELAPRVRDVRRMGSAAIDLCWVGAALTDAYVESGLHAWDVAAGALIAHEAGAVVLGANDPEAAPYVMASAPGIARDLMKVLDTA
jgi:myo-inositol-1(or 4)-monophosphatase